METPQDSQKTALTGNKIGAPIIGNAKYNMLKKMPVVTLSEIEIAQIEEYETRNEFILEANEHKKKYIEKLLSPEKEYVFEFTAMDLWKIFKAAFKEINGRDFVKNEQTIKNIEPLIYYFSKDERFFHCENLTRLSNPSFEKGLMIVGTFGNGKTATMKTFEYIFSKIPALSFKGYSANEVVKLFERGASESLKDEFDKMIFRGSRYFDDVKTERTASNYGKVNLFKDILENRYTNMNPLPKYGEKQIRRFTHITCNYKEGFEMEIEPAVDEFGELYGGRVYDRLFEMFNIVEFRGKSFRK